MINDKELKNIIFLWKNFTFRRKLEYLLLVVMMLIASIAEIISIGAILPFLAVLLKPDSIEHYQIAKYIVHLVSPIAPWATPMFIMVCIFLIAIVIAGSIRLFVLIFSQRLTHAVAIDIGTEMFERTLHQPYLVQIARNSSAVIATLTTKLENVIYQVMIPAVTFLSALLMTLFVVSFLIYIDPIAALSIFGGLGIFYFLIIIFTKRSLSQISKDTAQSQEFEVKIVSESLGGIRDIIIDKTYQVYVDSYRYSEKKLRNSQRLAGILGLAPRYVVEAIGIIVITLISYRLLQDKGDVSQVLPIIGALALGAQRLLPIFQQIFSSITSIRSGEEALADVVALLKQEQPPIPHDSQMLFENQVRVEHVCYQFSEENIIFDNVNFSFKKGSIVGLVGANGQGKSTLFDILMGLIPPTSGQIHVDDMLINGSNVHSWQKNITHVPQHIFLVDGSIAQNIALGVPEAEIDLERLKYATQIAEIYELIDAMPQKLNTIVGERGVRLSGGQRQRIGIARALYRKAEVIFLDEATSALDSETEKKVIENIVRDPSRLTILMIAHRISTLAKCNQIWKVENRQITPVSYSEISH